jgi:biotin carboxyl carrier protein
MTQQIEVTVNGTVYAVEVDDLDSANGTPIEVRVNGRPYTVQLGRPAEAVREAVSPAPVPAATPRPAPTPAPAPVAVGEGHQVTAPMPGKILSVAVQAGDRVQEKDTLCTLEAMKMEMNIAAPVTGTVREVRAQVGENVVHGDLLFVLD